MKHENMAIISIISDKYHVWRVSEYFEIEQIEENKFDENLRNAGRIFSQLWRGISPCIVGVLRRFKSLKCSSSSLVYNVTNRSLIGPRRREL